MAATLCHPVPKTPAPLEECYLWREPSNNGFCSFAVIASCSIEISRSCTECLPVISTRPSRETSLAFRPTLRSASPRMKMNL